MSSFICFSICETYCTLYDGLADRAALSSVQRHDAGCGHVGALLLQKISGLLITDRIGLLYIGFLVHIKVEIFLIVIFHFIQFHPGREPHFILFRCQGPHGLPPVFHPFFQPRKLLFG